MRITDEYVFFFGEKDPFSNFHRVAFTHQGQRFFCSEQAIMWRKAKLFGAERIAAQILRATTPKQCKDLGRSREIPFDEEVWRQNRIAVYHSVLIDKFQVPAMRKALLDTGDRMLVEASPYDTIWGIGLGADDPRADDPKQWRGKNLLGKTLYLVRELNLKARNIEEVKKDGKL